MAWPKGKPHSPETIAKLSRPRTPIADRYWAKVDRRGPDDCWPWLASKRPDGYGQMGARGSRPQVAHRIGWELAFGPIPEGGVIDHQCHNLDPMCPGGVCAHRACQNPAHWRVIDQAGNVLAGKSLAAMNARKTHCDRGHAFDAANTYVRPDGWRDCRTCKRAAQERYRVRRSA